MSTDNDLTYTMELVALDSEQATFATRVGPERRLVMPTADWSVFVYAVQMEVVLRPKHSDVS